MTELSNRKKGLATPNCFNPYLVNVATKVHTGPCGRTGLETPT